MQSSPSQIYLINESSIFRVYPQRFWVLFIFVFLAFNQCMFWLTFSPIATSTQTYYNVTETTVDLLLNWGPIVFLPTLPLTYLLLGIHHGLRKCILIFAIVSVVATVIRLIPSIATTPTSSNFHDIAVPFLHTGQILNAATGPIAMALVSQLSCVWFAPHERTRATTVAILGASFGGAAAFLISPFLVSEPSRIPHLLYLHAGLAVFACILTLAYFPAEPPSPPSVAAHVFSSKPLVKERPIEILKKFAYDVYTCCRDPSSALLIASGAIMGGTFSSWSSLFVTILSPIHYTEIEAGWFGFCQTVAGVIGSLLISFLADRPRFQRSLKQLILICFILCFLFCLIFQLCVPTIIWPNEPPLPSTTVSIGILLSVTGFFYGAGLPLVYECVAEMTYPLPEYVSASILVLLWNIVNLIFVAIAPNRYKLMNLLVLLMIVISIIMVVCARVTYRRKDEELGKKTAQEYFANQDAILDGSQGV